LQLHETADEYNIFYTGDCAFHDIRKGEAVGIISYDSCATERPFVCKAANVTAGTMVPFLPLAPPPPPDPPSPISPPQPYPPFPAVPLLEQRSSCYFWRMLSAPNDAKPSFEDAYAVNTKIQGAAT